MQESRLGLGRRKCIVALAATLVSVTPVLAQEQTNIRSISRYRLKPDRVGDFRSVVKDINAVLKKAGHNRAATWWQSQSGPREMALVAYYSKWAELGVMPAAFKEAGSDLAPLFARLQQCSDSVDRVVDEILPDHSLPMAANVPRMVRVLRLVVKPDRVDEYLALQKAEIVPAAKKAGLSTLLVARTRYGGSAFEFRSVIELKGWADLDGKSPLVEAMGGDAAYQKYLAKIRPILTEAEYNLYEHQADLSYLPTK
jgi:hypothetical protein